MSCVPPFWPLTIDMLVELVEQGRITPQTTVRFRTKDGLVIPADATSFAISETDGVSWIELREYDPVRMAEAITLDTPQTT